MKDKTLEELIALLEEVATELRSRRYFEYLSNIGKWVKSVPNPECPEKFPGSGIIVPIEGMEEILAAIDENKTFIEKHPQHAVYQNIRISRDELEEIGGLAGKLWDEAITKKE